MRISNKKKRILAVGCSHGEFANRDALAAVLLFREQFKPDTTIHLGDAYDTKAFRTGARPNSGDSDEAHPIEGDIAAGVHFLENLRPTVFCMGNHEQRLINLSKHHNTIIRAAANGVLKEILEPVKEAIIIPYTVLKVGWYRLGNFRFGHGHLYGENYLRDTAERWGNTVVAHAHRAGMSKGRRLDNPTAFGVGTLADIDSLEYAHGRASTLSWSHGFVFGEYDDHTCHLWLHEWPCGETRWDIPI
jgi:hypothetical protein